MRPVPLPGRVEHGPRGSPLVRLQAEVCQFGRIVAVDAGQVGQGGVNLIRRVVQRGPPRRRPAGSVLSITARAVEYAPSTWRPSRDVTAAVVIPRDRGAERSRRPDRDRTVAPITAATTPNSVTHPTR